MPTDTFYIDANASTIIAELNKTSKAMAGYNAELRQSAQLSEKLVSSTNGMTRTLTGIDKAGNKIIVTQKQTAAGWKSVSTSIDTAARSQSHLNKVTLAYGSLVRLVAVQLAHRAISSFISQTAQGIENITQIQQKLSEVRTISTDIPSSTEKWLDHTRQLSNLYGKDIKDQIEAVYQSLSNQIIQTGDDLAFLDSANKLALTAVSSTESAVNALSSVINSYGYNISQADELSAKLFKGVELGRFRIDEIANSIGSVAVIAKQTNITFEELVGSLAVLTQSGFKANEAMTQLRGIIVKILKPTKDMKKFLNELGVESGEDALRIYGLVGFLDKLRKSTNGSSTELGKMISRIRGLSGALLFTNDGFDKLRSTIEQVKDSSDSYNNATKEMADSLGTRGKRAAQQFTNELQKLSATFQESGVIISETLGGGDAAARTLTKSLVALTIAYLGYKAAVARGVATNKAGIIGGLVVGAAAVGIGFYESQVAKQEALDRARADARQRELDDAVSKVNKLTEIDREYIKKYVTLTLVSVASVRKEYDKLYSGLEKDYERLLKSAKYFSDSSVDGAEDVLAAYQKTLSTIESDLKAIEKLRGTLGRERDESILDVIIDQKSGEEKIKALDKLIKDSQKKVTDAAKAGDKSLFDYYRKQAVGYIKGHQKAEEELFKEQAKNDKQRAKILEQISKKEYEAKFDKKKSATVKAEIEVLKRQLNDIERLEYKRTDHAKLLDRVYKQQEKDLSVLETRLKAQADLARKQELETRILVDQLKLANEQILKFKPDKADDPAKSIEEQADAWKRVVGLRKQLGLETKDEGLESIYRKQTELLQGRVKVYDVLKKQIQDVKDAERESTKQLVALRGKQAGLDRERVRAVQLIKDVQAAAAPVLSDEQLSPRTKQAIENLTGLFDDPTKVGKYGKAIRAAVKELQNIRSNLPALVSTDELDALLQAAVAAERRYASIEERFVLTKAESLFQEEYLKKIKSSVDESESLRRKTTGIRDNLLDSLIPASKLSTAFFDMSVSASNLEASLKNIKGSLPDGSTTAIKPVTGNYTGRIYGRDSISTNVSPGESIINDRNTKRFYSQLVAINGKPPTMIQPAGTTIGDINVTLNGSGSAPVDARSIATELKRLMKRGIV